MVSTGIMASSVVPPAGTVDVLLENFTSVADWTGTISSVAGGRTGNAGQVTGSNTATYTIPALNENAVVTVGFAYKVNTIAATRLVLQVLSDGSSLVHDSVRVNTTGSLSALLGGVSGTIQGTTATGLIAINTWYYLETQYTLHDTAGAVTLRVNGTEVLNVSGIDTRSGGTKSVFDAIRLAGGGSGATSNYDDLYLTVGAGAAFKGDTTVP